MARVIARYGALEHSSNMAGNPSVLKGSIFAADWWGFLFLTSSYLRELV